MTEIQQFIELTNNSVDLAILNNFADMQEEGEPDLIVELIDLYLADTPPRLATMREGLANCDKVSLARAAHAVKGSSATLGAGLLAEFCAEVELLARDVSFQKIALVLDRLEQEYISAQTAFLIQREKRSSATR